MKFDSVPLPKDKDLPEAIQKKLAEMPALNIFRMLANVERSFTPYIQLAASLLGQGKFEPRIRQIAILRQAHLIHSRYEWHQHVFLSKANGVTDREIEVIRSENPVHSLGPEENFVCRVSEELTLNATLTDATFGELFERYSIELGTELILALSYANMLGRFINATRVQIEATNPLEGRKSPIS
jgi:alkylhydroperoxidase family enzyme